MESERAAAFADTLCMLMEVGSDIDFCLLIRSNVFDVSSKWIP